MEEVRIKSSKLKNLFFLLIAAALVHFGFLMLAQDASQIEVQRKFNNPIFVYGLGLFGSIFGVLGVVVAIPKILGLKPGLKINQHGIHDNSSGVSAGSISWKDITNISDFTVNSQKFLAIHVKEPMPYLNKGNYLQRLIKKSNMKLYGTPICISQGTLNIDYDELFKLIHEYRAYYQGI